MEWGWSGVEWNTCVLGAWGGGVLAVGFGGWDVRMELVGLFASEEGLLGE
jgi:hypothetical protein